MKQAAFLLLLLAACKHNDPPKPQAVVVAVAPAVVDAGPEIVASVDAGPAKRDGAPGSTKGSISCGDVRCNAQSQTCALDAGRWHCVDRDTASSTPHYDCDDVADCQYGGATYDACCSADLQSAVCGYMSAADSVPCNFAVCNTDHDAPPCPKGQSCVEGICRPPPPRATCTGKKRCPAETPICSWESGKGECIAKSSGDAGDVSIFECTRPSDCGPGFTCCTPAGGELLSSTRCQAGCGQDLEVVCETSKECPPIYTTGMNGGKLVPTKCKARSAGNPAWAGKCE